MPSRIPASERTSQKLDELLTQGVADGDARAELLKLAVRKIVEEALEAEVADAVGRGYYENGAPPQCRGNRVYKTQRARTASGNRLRAPTINDFAKLGTALGGTPTIGERLTRAWELPPRLTADRFLPLRPQVQGRSDRGYSAISPLP